MDIKEIFVSNAKWDMVKIININVNFVMQKIKAFISQSFL